MQIDTSFTSKLKCGSRKQYFGGWASDGQTVASFLALCIEEGVKPTISWSVRAKAPVDRGGAKA